MQYNVTHGREKLFNWSELNKIVSIYKKKKVCVNNTTESTPIFAIPKYFLLTLTINTLYIFL